MATYALGVTARYAVPATRPGLLPRTALVDQLHAAVGSGVTILQAPAGYGKTTLAAAFVRDVDFEPRWLTLDSTAVAPEAFAEQVVTAVLRESAWRPAGGEQPGALAAYIAAALREFDESSSRPMVLVIDNVHEIAEAEQSLELLSWLVESVPLGTELLLLSRKPIPLVGLDRRILGGEVLVLGPTDLLFTAEEIQELASGRGSSLNVAEALRVTGGWPIAVAGALNGTLSLTGAASAVAAGTWERYLATEISGVVPESLSAAFMRAAIPEVAEPGLVTLLMDRAAWDDLAGWLRANAFFCQWSDDGDVRINPVVQRYWRDSFRQVDPAGYRLAVETLGAALEAAGRTDEAIELAASSGEVDVTVALLKSEAPQLLQRGAFAVLQRILDSLPPAVVERDRHLQALRARVLAQIGSPAEALTLADRIEHTGDVEAAHHARLARGRALHLLGRMAEVKQCYDVPLDDLPANQLLVAEHMWHKAHGALAVDSDFNEARRILTECMDASVRAEAPYLSLLAESTIGYVLMLQGDGPASVQVLTQAARAWRERHGGAYLAWVLNNLGMAHMMVGDTESALDCLSQGRDESRAAGDRRAEAFTTASLGDAYLAGGEFRLAAAHYEEAISACVDSSLDESLTALATAGLAGALLGLDEIERADLAIRQAVGIAERLGSPDELATCLIQQAAVLSAAESHAEAIGIAERAVEAFRAIGAHGSLRQALYRLALIQFRDGNRDAAEETLGRLVDELSEPWMARCLLPAIREHPLFAKWADSRSAISPTLHRVLRDGTLDPQRTVAPAPERETSGPHVFARSLGSLRVTVDGREVTDEAWESIRAKEMFYLFLAHPDGIRKETAVEMLYPDLASSRCNSQFHSNLYRVRKALYHDSVVKRDGAYMLNPDRDFSWDVREFEQTLNRAARLSPGSSERAASYEKALQLYRGPFAEAFYSEWAASLRDALARRQVEALATLAGYYAGRSEFEAAAECMEQVLRASRFNDEAAYLLATYRVRAGQPTAAIAFIDSYRSELEQELDVGLPPRMQRLRATLAAGAV